MGSSESSEQSPPPPPPPQLQEQPCTCASKVKYITIFVLECLCVLMFIVGQTSPLFSKTESDTQTQIYLFDVCWYSKSTGAKIACESLEDIERRSTEKWCPSHKSFVEGARAAGIIGTLLSIVCALVTFETKIWGCVFHCFESLSNAFFRDHADKVFLALGPFVCGIAAFSLELEFFNTLPSDCRGTPFSQRGFSLDGGPFCFLFIFLLSVAVALIDYFGFGWCCECAKDEQANSQGDAAPAGNRNTAAGMATNAAIAHPGVVRAVAHEALFGSTNNNVPVVLPPKEEQDTKKNNKRNDDRFTNIGEMPVELS